MDETGLWRFTSLPTLARTALLGPPLAMYLGERQGGTGERLATTSIQFLAASKAHAKAIALKRKTLAKPTPLLPHALQKNAVFC